MAETPAAATAEQADGRQACLGVDADNLHMNKKTKPGHACNTLTARHACSWRSRQHQRQRQQLAAMTPQQFW